MKSIAIFIFFALLFAVINAASAQEYHKIVLFGGASHDIYLGCLNCTQSARDSIFNVLGPYGHCPGPFSDNIFCRGPFKEFGSTGPFHNHSACASSPSDPPAIVDEQGNYYGRFSLGDPFGHRDSVCALFSRFRSDEACRIVKWVCDDDKREQQAEPDDDDDD